jgi:FecR protein
LEACVEIRHVMGEKNLKVRKHFGVKVAGAIFISCLFASAGLTQQTPSVVGQVVVSSGTTQNGIALPSGGTIFDGDVVATDPTGRMQVKLSPTNQITLNENSSAVFSKVLDQTRLQLQKGNVVVESAGKNLIVVATPKFKIEPPTEGVSKIYVGLMADNSTYIESAEGDTVIVDAASGESYVLSAGQNALVPENATGIPGLQPETTAVASNTPAQPPVTETPPPQPASPQPPAVKPPPTHGSGALIGVLAAAGAAGGIAAAAAGGGGSSGGGGRPASPSAP